MLTKKDIKKFWKYIENTFEKDEIESALDAFEFERKYLKALRCSWIFGSFRPTFLIRDAGFLSELQASRYSLRAVLDVGSSEAKERRPTC